MSKLAEQRVCKDDHDRRVMLALTDAVFELFRVNRLIKFGDEAEDVLAAHLNIKVEDVRKWFRGEALSN